MRKLSARSLAVMSGLSLAATLLMGSPANADTGNSACSTGMRAKEYPSVGWQLFVAHKVVADGADCRSLLPTKFFGWTKTPHITTPNTFPSGIAEEVSVTQQPVLTSQSNTQVVYKFEVTQKTVKIGSQKFVLTLTYNYDNGIRICNTVGGACSSWHW